MVNSILLNWRRTKDMNARKIKEIKPKEINMFPRRMATKECT